VSDYNRLHAFDAVRALALLSGVVLHSTMSFFVPLPALDCSQSVFLGIIFYFIHMFRMSAFYFIAGFFGRMVFQRKGFKEFAKDRSKRILIPLFCGWIVLAPFVIGAAVWGAIRMYGLEVVKSMPSTGFPLLHLWFLYYLSIFYFFAMLLHGLFSYVIDRTGGIRAIIDRIVRLLINSAIAPIIFAAPAFAALYFNPAWPIWFGIPTPDKNITPQIPALAGFGAAFCIGWLLHRQMDLLKKWEQRWAAHFVFALVLTILCLSMAGISPNFRNPTSLEGAQWSRLAYTACYALGMWCWTIGIIGGALRFLKNMSSVRRYISDASYWIYLVHLPIIFILQVAMMKWPLHWSVKFILILGITLGLALASYHWLVRSTFIGAILNGKRRPNLSRSSRLREDNVPAEQDWK
jgi:peptidoglycan/LPS O-acetylase OafA/YrhL